MLASKRAPNRRKRKRPKPGGSSKRLSKRHIIHALLERNAESLTRKLIEKALAGDTACLRLCIERLDPPYKAAPVPIEHDEQDKNKVITLRIFEDTGTAEGLKEVLASRDEATQIEPE
jgi:hypothetical protein